MRLGAVSHSAPRPRALLAHASRVSYTTSGRCPLTGELYFDDPRLDLIPTEHLAADGVDADFLERLLRRPGWTRPAIDLLERSIELYWDRYERIASDVGYLAAPRLRNLGVVRDASTVRPYAQILNESTCTLYLEDLDPETSHAELVAYVLAFGERAAETTDMLRTAVHLAPWWFERTEAECEAFVCAAATSRRPDADLYQAIGAAIPWLRELRHRRARPARRGRPYREIPGTGLLVPRAREQEPDRLVAKVQASATRTLRAFHAAQRGPADAEIRGLAEWLAAEAPLVVVTDARTRVLWDPEAPTVRDALVERLRDCGPRTVESLRRDLACVDEHSRRFLASLREPEALPRVPSDLAQSGYTFLHRDRGIIGYNVDEPGIERLLAPAIPYARAMLGARTLHEWAHLAVDAGWVPRAVSSGEWSRRRQALVGALRAVIDGLPRAAREVVGPDLARLGAGGDAGEALADVFEGRLSDYRSNLLAARYQTPAEREAYVRQNVRPLRREYPPSERLRMLVRYVYERQYLRFSEIEAEREYFDEHTWFEADFVDTGFLDEERLTALLHAAAEVCHAFDIDRARFTDAT